MNIDFAFPDDAGRLVLTGWSDRLGPDTTARVSVADGPSLPVRIIARFARADLGPTPLGLVAVVEGLAGGGRAGGSLVDGGLAGGDLAGEDLASGALAGLAQAGEGLDGAGQALGAADVVLRHSDEAAAAQTDLAPLIALGDVPMIGQALDETIEALLRGMASGAVGSLSRAAVAQLVTRLRATAHPIPIETPQLAVAVDQAMLGAGGLGLAVGWILSDAAPATAMVGVVLDGTRITPLQIADGALQRRDLAAYRQYRVSGFDGFAAAFRLPQGSVAANSAIILLTEEADRGPGLLLRGLDQTSDGRLAEELCTLLEAMPAAISRETVLRAIAGRQAMPQRDDPSALGTADATGDAAFGVDAGARPSRHPPEDAVPGREGPDFDPMAAPQPGRDRHEGRESEAGWDEAGWDEGGWGEGGGTILAIEPDLEATELRDVIRFAVPELPWPVEVRIVGEAASPAIAAAVKAAAIELNDLYRSPRPGIGAGPAPFGASAGAGAGAGTDSRGAAAAAEPVAAQADAARHDQAQPDANRGAADAGRGGADQARAGRSHQASPGATGPNADGQADACPPASLPASLPNVTLGPAIEMRDLTRLHLTARVRVVYGLASALVQLGVPAVPRPGMAVALIHDPLAALLEGTPPAASDLTGRPIITAMQGDLFAAMLRGVTTPALAPAGLIGAGLRRLLAADRLRVVRAGQPTFWPGARGATAAARIDAALATLPA